MFSSKALMFVGALAATGAALADLNSGLIAHWTFDDCTAADSSGNGHNGSIAGAPLCVKGVNGFGKALQFNGSSDFIEVADSTALRLSGTSYTFSGWALLESYNGSYVSTLVSKWDGADVGYLWSLTGYAVPGPLGRLHITVARAGASEAIYLSSKGAPLNAWRHFVMTYDATTDTSHMFVNNALDGSAVNFPSPAKSNGIPLRLAKSNDPSEPYGYYFLDGMLDDVRIYNRVLSADEIADLYNMFQPISGNTKGLQDMTVTCTNTTTGQTVTVPDSTNLAWSCKKAGLKAKPGQSINISIDGNVYPQ